MTLKFTEKMEIAQFLAEVTFDNNGSRSYKQSWTDVRVADEFGVTAYIVSAIRKDVYPDFVRRTKQEDKGPTRASLTSLETKLAELEQRLLILEHGQPVQNIGAKPYKAERKPLSRWDHQA